MESELTRLSIIGWKIPEKDGDGIFTPKEIDEDTISFPSEGYSGEETNSEATGFWAAERAKSIYDLLERNGVKTLWEIGAGNGNAAFPLRSRGIEVIPIEPLRSGAVTLSKNGFVTFQATLEDLSFPDNSIGAIGAFDVLEHLEDRANYLPKSIEFWSLEDTLFALSRLISGCLVILICQLVISVDIHENP
jgi:hypothetical protein